MKTFFKKAAVMTLAVMTSAVMLDVSSAISAEAASAEGDCEVDHSIAMTWTCTGGEFTANGNYYLTDEVTLSAEIEITGNVTLCLNGQTIKAAPDSRLFTVKNGGSLTICDCDGDGKITGGAPTDVTDSNGNIQPSRGGAVRVEKGGEFTMYGGTISGNEAKEGAGVYNSGTFTMYGGTISDNTAAHQGGGVYVWGSSSDSAEFTMSGGTISGNRVENLEESAGNYGGGGVYTAGIFTMNSGTISENTADFCYGGGVCVSIGGVFTMSGDSTISENISTSWYAGGVYVSGGTFNMESGTIIKNEAAEGGGGVCLGDRAGTEFTMSGGEISENTAKNGGGVHVVSGTFNMTDGTIDTNEASNGGGVYVSGGTVNVTDDGTITENKASKNGGGVYVGNGTFNMADGTIDTNEASNNGGGVHINGGTFNMTGGEIVENKAVKGGGGACLNDGTMLLDGTVTIKSNEMTGGSASNVYLMKHVDSNGKLDKDKTITIGEHFDTAEEIGVHASITPNCKDYINAAEFAANTPVKDISGYFKADVDKGVVYDENEEKLKLFGPHNAAKTDAAPPTCLDNGNTEYWHCSVCNKNFSDSGCMTELTASTVVPATGHNYGEWIITKAPTLTTEGTATRICANDPSHIETIPIPPPSNNNPGNNSSTGSSGNTDNSSNSDDSSDDNTIGNTDNNDSNDSGHVTDNPATGLAVSLVPLAAGIIAFTVTVKRNKK